MQTIYRPAFTLALLVAVLAFSILIPIVAHAQSGDLRTTIRAELLSDPRTSGLTEEQLSTMVTILAAEAQKRGITASDITWRPANEESFASAAQASDSSSECGNIPSFLCSFNRAFGFAGSDPTIPFVLGGSAMLLILLIGLIIHYERHKVHAI